MNSPNQKLDRDRIIYLAQQVNQVFVSNGASILEGAMALGLVSDALSEYVNQHGTGNVDSLDSSHEKFAEHERNVENATNPTSSEFSAKDEQFLKEMNIKL